jgi:thiol-disulfide isomerase/thioredoxin
MPEKNRFDEVKGRMRVGRKRLAWIRFYSTASGGAVREVGSKVELEAVVAGTRATVVHFWAGWCEASMQMDEVFAHLAVDFPHALFLRVSDAELHPERLNKKKALGPQP